MIQRGILEYFSKEPDVMTVPEVAKLLRCGKNTLYELIKSGKIETLRLGRRILIPKCVLVEYITNEKNYQIINPIPPDRHWTSRK